MKFCRHLLVTLLLAMPFAAIAQKPFVIDSNGQKIDGESLEADASGTLKLALEGGGAARNFRRGSYKSAWRPKPPEVAAAEEMIRKKDVSNALRALEEAYRKYRYVGWAGDIGTYRGRLLMEAGKHADAEQVYRDAISMPNSESADARLKQGLIESLLAQDKVPAARTEIERLRTTEESVAAFVFNARGQLLMKEGKPKEAVLQYLKTVLLFDKEIGSVRKEALQQVIAILESLKDNRAAAFKAKYTAEYGK